MLGDMISESHGKRMYRRVLSSNPLKVEVSFEETGTIYGTQYQGFGTYTAEAQADGKLVGTGEGVVLTADGEAVGWKGLGKGQISPGGLVSYRGTLLYQTTSQKLGKINGVTGAFEFDSGPDGATHSKVWEWK